jgi:hypothetical protein
LTIRAKRHEADSANAVDQACRCRAHLIFGARADSLGFAVRGADANFLAVAELLADRAARALRDDRHADAELRPTSDLAALIHAALGASLPLAGAALERLSAGVARRANARGFAVARHAFKARDAIAANSGATRAFTRRHRRGLNTAIGDGASWRFPHTIDRRAGCAG